MQAYILYHSTTKKIKLNLRIHFKCSLDSINQMSPRENLTLNGQIVKCREKKKKIKMIISLINQFFYYWQQIDQTGIQQQQEDANRNAHRPKTKCQNKVSASEKFNEQIFKWRRLTCVSLRLQSKMTTKSKKNSMK